MKLNNTNRRILSWVVIIFFAITIIGLTYSNYKSYYTPKDIKISPVNVDDLFKLRTSEKCLPGSTKDSDAYTLSNKGVCNAQETVYGHASYEIVDGIGDELI